MNQLKCFKLKKIKYHNYHLRIIKKNCTTLRATQGLDYFSFYINLVIYLIP